MPLQSCRCRRRGGSAIRYQGKRRRRYRRDVYRFAVRFATPNEELTEAEIVSTVKTLTASYGVTDERLVVADVQDAIHEIVHVRWPRAPMPKTRDEFLADGRPDLAAEWYPKGGTIEEVLLSKDEPPAPA